MSIFHATKSHCLNGHPLTTDNIKQLSNGSGHRVCLMCHRANGAVYRAARRKPRKTPAQRFWEKIEKTETCWLWKASLAIGGYGVLSVGGRDGGQMYAHRFSYRLHKGPVPDGLDLDHLCRNRACVNPSHLEAVTRQENLRRGLHTERDKTHCKHGHERTPENLYLTSQGGRACRICRQARHHQGLAKLLAAKEK